jgi:hypothetical protein
VDLGFVIEANSAVRLLDVLIFSFSKKSMQACIKSIRG